jgi:hypothetical protein
MAKYEPLGKRAVRAVVMSFSSSICSLLKDQKAALEPTPERRPQLFTYRLILKDGAPADPPQFVTATPTWHVGDTFFTRPVEHSGFSRSTTARTAFTRSGP